MKDPKTRKTPAKTADAKAAAKPAVPPGMIRCRRVDAFYSPEEHARCPYCYGKESDVSTGEHGRFCDFKPGEDPINFGFPTDRGRYAH